MVIGGLNRSGKTTFMQVLRHLGYGFAKANLPPPTFEYDVGADLKVDGSVYGLKLSGFGRPQLKRLSGPGEEITDIRNIYHVDAFTYKQLFTISLDELAAVQESAGGDKHKLQSILLGAGFKDIMILPQLREHFFNQGDIIGGKRGSPDVKLFKSYHDNIVAGQRLKRKALSQVAEYQIVQSELALTEEKIAELVGELKDKAAQINRLDVLKNNFADYKNYLELRAQLEATEKDRWEGGPSEELLAQIKSKLRDLEASREELQSKKARLNLQPRVLELLLAEGNELELLCSGVSGIEERIQSWERDKGLQRQKEADFKKRSKAVNSDWGFEASEKIKSIKTDTIADRRLSELVEEYRSLEGECQSGATEVSRLQRERKELKENISLLLAKKPPATKTFIVILAALALTASILAFTMPKLLILPLIGALGVFGVFIKNAKSLRPETILHNQAEKLRQLEVELSVREEVLEGKSECLQKVKEELAVYREALQLDATVPYGTLPHYLLQVRELQDKIYELEGLASKIRANEQYLATQYRRYEDFLAPLVENRTGRIEKKETFAVDLWPPLLARLAKWRENLAVAREINILARSLAAQEKEIKASMVRPGFAIFTAQGGGAGGGIPTGGPAGEEASAAENDTVEANTTVGEKDLADKDIVADVLLKQLVEAFGDKGRRGLEFKAKEDKLAELERSLLSALRSDAVRRAFGLSEFSSEASLLEAFQEEYFAHAGKEEAERAYSQALREEEEKSMELQRLREVKQNLANRLKSLAAPDNLHEGQRIIDTNREKLRVLAERYALNMTASFLLEKVEKNLLHKMKDDVMTGAGRIFNRMTRGEYEGIVPTDSLGFEAVPAAEKEQQTIDMLSRGTREQLYLAVRLSRILAIKPPLPIIIDDSLANFDNPHLGRSLGILAEMAKSHQIFILTCHRALLENIKELGSEAQYWKLAAGQFSLSDYRELSDHLA